MKRQVSVLLAILCTMLFAFSTAHAMDNLKVLSVLLEESYSDGQLVKILNDIDLMKEAELSYQKSLVTPFMNLGECKDQTQLSVMAGMYLLDSTYALVFGKQGEFIQARRAMITEVAPRVTVLESKEFKPVPHDLVKAVAENPNDAKKRTELYEQVQKNLDKLIKQSSKDADVFKFLIDALYGTVIQGLYVTCSLAQDAEMGPQILGLFKSQASNVAKLELAMNAIDTEQLKKSTYSVERHKTLSAVGQILKDNKEQLSGKDIQAILKIVTEARAPFVKQCQ